MIKSLQERTGVLIPKRQAELLSQKEAMDFDLFYERRLFDPEILRSFDEKPLLILTTDSKGVVMITDDLRDVTKEKAKAAKKKLKKRLSRGEKTNSKRMAQVASVYSIDRYLRTPEQVAGIEDKSATPQPRPVGKRVWASVTKDQEDVIVDLFNEAETRDPEQKKEWIVLIDGQTCQLERIKAEAWVTERFLEVFKGNAKLVSAGIGSSTRLRSSSEITNRSTKTQ